MAERRKTADDVVRRIAGYFARDDTPPALIGPSGAVSGTATRPAPGVGFKNPMSAVGDLIRGGTSGAAVRLVIGASGEVLTVVAGKPAWAASGGSSATRDLLTNGDATDPQLIFAGGDVIWIEA